MSFHLSHPQNYGFDTNLSNFYILSLTHSHSHAEEGKNPAKSHLSYPKAMGFTIILVFLYCISHPFTIPIVMGLNEHLSEIWIVTIHLSGRKTFRPCEPNKTSEMIKSGHREIGRPREDRKSLMLCRKGISSKSCNAHGDEIK